jgi:hypothetical protein
MKESLDDQVSSIAQEYGSKTIRELGQNWKVQEVLADATNRGNFQLPGSSTGSPTAEKSALQRMLGFGGTAGGVTALGQDWEDPDKIAGNLAAIAGAGILGSVLARSLGGIKNAAMASMDDILIAATTNPKLAQRIEQIAGTLKPISRAAGQGLLSTGIAAGEAGKALDEREDQVQQLELGLEGQGSPREIGQEAKAEQAGEPSEYLTMIERRLYQRFAQMYPDYAQDDEAFGQFMDSARRASNDFDPKRTAKLLFPREDDRKAYLAALSAKESVSRNVPGVGQRDQGFFGLGAKPLTDEQVGARATLEGAFVEAAKLANVDTKNAKDLLRQIVDGEGTLTQKRQRILNQVRAWNEQGFEALAMAGLGGV